MILQNIIKRFNVVNIKGNTHNFSILFIYEGNNKKYFTLKLKYVNSQIVCLLIFTIVNNIMNKDFTTK